MRRHSEGWLIKILLGLISLSFVAFFGYSAVSDRQLGAQTAALVGDQAIPLKQYEQAYDAALGRIQGQFPEGVPENFSKYLRSNILEQLIQRRVITEYAQTLGFRISDDEVAQMIRKQKQFYRDGLFDMNYYQKQFRPYYRQQFGIDFEKALRNDLLIDQYQTFRSTSPLTPKDITDWRSNVAKKQWAFDVIEVPLSAAKVQFPDDPKAADKLKDVVKDWVAKWEKGPISKSILKKYEAKEHDRQTISYLDRSKLLGRQLPEDHAAGLFKMSQNGQVYPEPIRLGGSWYLVKLVQTQEGESTESAQDLGSQLHNTFFTIWLDDFREQLTIKSNIAL